MNLDIFYELMLALAGLGVILYGIKVMNSSIETVIGPKFKQMLGKASNNNFKNYLIGTGTTFVVQTSVLTVTMATGLVNIGSIGLAQALALVLGANLGSALSMVLMAFESINLLQILSTFCLIGIIVLLCAKRTRTEVIGRTLLGFGLLCLGITLLGSSMQNLAGLMDMQSVLSTITNPLLLMFLGMAFSLIMQSSFPVLTILIALVGTGAMEFIPACYAIYGSNLGTALIIMFLTRFGDGVNGRKVVGFNVIFKIFSCILFPLLMLIPAWAEWIHFDLCAGNGSISLVLIMILFNFVPSLLLLPFSKPLAAFMNLIVKKGKKSAKSEYDDFELDDRIINNPVIAFRSVRQNAAKILDMQISLNKKLCAIIFDRDQAYVSQKGKLKAIEKAIKLTTNSAIRVGSRYKNQLDRINILLNILNDNSQILRVNSRFDDFAKTIKNKPRSLLNSQIEVLKNLSNDINDLGEKVNLLLKESASSNQDELKKIFEINDINIDKNTQARCNLVQNVLENRKIDTQSYFTLLYEFGKLETDYMDIAIKTILMEE